MTTMALRLNSLRSSIRAICQVRAMSDSQQPGWGSGAGKGGGSGGSIREAGGAFGKMEAAREEQYFKKQTYEQLKVLKESIHDEIMYHHEEIKEHEQAEQLKVLRESLHDEIKYHEKEIEEHQESILRHKKKMQALKDVETLKKADQ